MDNAHSRVLKISLVTLGDPNTLTGGYLYHRRLAKLAPAFDARIRFVSFPQRPFPLALLDAPAVLGRASRAGTDALVLDSIAAPFAGPWLSIHSLRLPLLGMLHQPPGGIDHGPPRSVVQAVLDNLSYRKAALLMVASESLRDELVARGVPSRKLRVVPPGRDTETIPRPASGQEVYRFTRDGLRRGRRAAALCVANWVERKGIHSLLEAISASPEETVTLHLVGDDRADQSYAARVRRRLSKPDLARRVVMHGPLSAQAASALYQAADMFVLPSTKEPYGTVFGEAMAAGLPVVGWRAGNLPYLADNEREGLLAEVGDIAGLGNMIRRLAEDEGLRKGMGKAARLRAQGYPTWEETAKLFFSTVREVVEG